MKRRKPITVYPTPTPARLVLAEALGITHEEAAEAMRALIMAGYGVVPKNPTDGMFDAALNVTQPPKTTRAVITAMGKARARWQAMFEEGVGMTLSLKYVPDNYNMTKVAPAHEAESSTHD